VTSINDIPVCADKVAEKIGIVKMQNSPHVGKKIAISVHRHFLNGKEIQWFACKIEGAKFGWRESNNCAQRFSGKNLKHAMQIFNNMKNEIEETI
jgi:hypothetical protein